MIIKSWLRIPNFGDLLNNELIYLMTGFYPKLIPAIDNTLEDNYLFIGSVLGYSSSNSIVWGSGLLGNMKITRPKEIRAVRGPLTRDCLINQGIDCPEVYGDPALLLPKYYRPSVNKKEHRLGIIAHWGDELALKKYNTNNVFVIRHDLPTYQFIDAICSCEKVASSSLHGIIVADAYGVPSIQLKFDEPIYQFKFDDYFCSVGRPLVKPTEIISSIIEDQLLNNFYDYTININLDKLLDSCPFKNRIIISPYSRALRGTKDINAKNYPYFNEVVSGLKNLGYYVIQLGCSSELKLDKVDEFLVNYPLKNLSDVIRKSTTWVSVDNFFQHLAWYLDKKGVAIFGKSDPEIFGHSENINLLKDRKYLRQRQFAQWEEEKFDAEVFVSKEIVLQAIGELCQNQ